MVLHLKKKEWQKSTLEHGLPPYLGLTVLILGGQPTSVDTNPPEGLLPVDELDPNEQRRLCRLVDRYAAQHRCAHVAKAIRDYCGLSTVKPSYVAASSWEQDATFEEMWDLIYMMRDDLTLHEQILDLYRAPDYTVVDYDGYEVVQERLSFYDLEVEELRALAYA